MDKVTIANLQKADQMRAMVRDFMKDVFDSTRPDYSSKIATMIALSGNAAIASLKKICEHGEQAKDEEDSVAVEACDNLAVGIMIDILGCASLIEMMTEFVDDREKRTEGGGQGGDD